jgi:hypothetical protein
MATWRAKAVRGERRVAARKSWMNPCGRAIAMDGVYWMPACAGAYPRISPRGLRPGACSRLHPRGSENVRQKLQHQIRARRARGRATAKGMFGTMAEAGAAAYSRARDLPKLIALWPHELDDESQEGMFRVLGKLRRALRAERRRGLASHWSYDLNRHLGLLSAYKGELAGLRLRRQKA